MTTTETQHSHPAIDVHTHVAPSHAEHLATIMEANNLSAVVNLGSLEWLGIPFEAGNAQRLISSLQG
jgi:hypothetical protein